MDGWMDRYLKYIVFYFSFEYIFNVVAFSKGGA